MDKIKPVLAVVKKHYFWGLCGLIVLLALMSWAKATSGLVDRFTERKTALENHFKEMQNISSIADHPNAVVIDSLVKETNALVDKVLQAWEVLYKEQNDKNKLPAGLSDEFKQAFAKTREAYDRLKAGEKLKPGEELVDKLLEEYQYFIEEHFKAFFAIVDVRRPADDNKKKTSKPGRPALFQPRPEAEVGPGRQGGDAEAPMVGVVDWDETDQQRIQGRFHWMDRPTTEQVLLAQEDLWVYEALLRIIKNTNGGAANNYEAAVRRIEFLQIGGDVGRMARDAGQHSATAGSSEGVLINLLAGRYVDGNLTPLAAGAPAPYAEFKMMPVRMQLVVQQQKLPKLLAECANSTMPIEVRVVRLWPGAAPPLDAVSSTGAEASGGTTPSATDHTSGHGDSGGGGPAEGNAKDVPIEIAGIIYIYNPPDKERLGTGAAAQGAAATGEEAPAEESPEGAEPTDEAAPMEEPPAEPEPTDEPAPMEEPDPSAEPPTALWLPSPARARGVGGEGAWNNDIAINRSRPSPLPEGKGIMLSA